AGWQSAIHGGFQGADAIAVRDPSVHWSGEKALFSMVVGATEKQYIYPVHYWQLYEITGLGKDETPVITKVPNQPPEYNNISPIYGTDDRILFTSDRPRSGERHLYPQIDEYEKAPTNTGLWSLDPANGDLFLLNHAPSGDFTPTIDSFGRVIFTQWDHLQRDQHADADAHFGTDQACENGNFSGTFNYSDESASAEILDDRSEIFPEPRACREDLLAGTNMVGLRFNHFFPWTILEDGTESEVLNHLGRHELHAFIAAGITGDSNVSGYFGQYPRFNPNAVLHFFQIKEDPLHPGRYYAVNAPEFGTHASGQIFRVDAPPGRSADEIAVTYVTHATTFSSTDEDETPDPNHSGHYREPLPLSDGTLVAVHTAETRADHKGDPTTDSRYDFRLKTLKLGANGFWEANQPLTGGISKTLSFWDPDKMVTFSGNLWELNPVEVRPRSRPQRLTQSPSDPIQQVFAKAGVEIADFQEYLRARDLALLVTHDVTTRDDLDRQQPFNLRVPGGTSTIGASGATYDVTHLQIFQADQLRGTINSGNGQPYAGRRVLAQYLHDEQAIQHNGAISGHPGSVKVAADGSVAAFVPARRAMTWQLTDDAGDPVVRERYWITFQPGEVRVCGSCHGLSSLDQAGATSPTNEPEALLALLVDWSGVEVERFDLYLPLIQGD
ncbi:MAG: hypothetical protein HC802_20010, partial [Caldilineaceae bacterium]|nr:hypothetical protein [Caldilineaceae bacterium]